MITKKYFYIFLTLTIFTMIELRFGPLIGNFYMFIIMSVCLVLGLVKIIEFFDLGFVYGIITVLLLIYHFVMLGIALLVSFDDPSPY